MTSPSVNVAVRETIRTAPRAPGVYLFRDAKGEPVYIGKAKDLAARLASYRGRDVGPKTRVMLRRATSLETIVAPNEAEALVLECALIKRHRPRYNVSLKDDKRYPYVVRTKDPFPQFFLTRRPDPRRGRIFGPFPDAGAVRRALEVLSRLYRIRRCPGPLPKRDRPCLDAEIGRCDAPCVGRIDRAAYAEGVAAATLLLEGKTNEAEALLRSEMARSAKEMDFETAALRRDEAAALATLGAKTLGTVRSEGNDADVFVTAGQGRHDVAVVLEIREGNLLGRRRMILVETEELTPSERLAEAMKRFYADTEPPARIFVFEAPAEDLLPFLSRGGKVRVEIPRRGLGARLLAMARENAEEYLRLLSLEAAHEAGAAGPGELARILGLGIVPDRIEAYDVATLQGGETVAARVAFAHGKIDKSGYRRYRIRTPEIVPGRPDDFAAMREVFARRARAAREKGDEMPDLLLVDGGAGQLSAALEGLGGAAGETVVLALAKRFEEIRVAGRKGVIRLAPRNPARRLLQRMRDEAHRFAGRYHRELRRKTLL